MNTYILKKTYCLNKDVNTTIINKGLYTENKKCDLYNPADNKGNGMIFCEPKGNLTLNMIKNEGMILTKLSNYIQFFSNKNLVLIKMDIEGGDGKAIEGGMEIISKYHVPFILTEFSLKKLMWYNTDPRQFLQMFENNGYKISPESFFDKNKYSIDDIINRAKGIIINLFLVYSKVLE